MTQSCQVRILVFALLVVYVLPVAVAGRSPFIDAFFEPFAYLDMGQVYDRYHAIIDFFLFTLIFTSVAQATLGKRFGGRPGRAVSIGLGLAMGLSLAITEGIWGFSLRSLGPVAALVLGSVSALFLYRVVRQLGLARTPAILLTLLAVYFLIGGLSPEAVDWAVRYHIIGWIHFVLLVLLIMALVSFFSGKGFESIKKRIAAVEVRPLKKVLPLELGEKRFVRRRLERETKMERREAASIVETLSKLIDEVKKGGHKPPVRERVVSELASISSRVQELRSRLEYLRALTTKIETLDGQVIGELRAKRGALSAEEEARVRSEIQLEVKKLQTEENLERMEKLTAAYEYNFQEAIKLARDYLANNQIEIALGWLRRAMRYEESVEKMLVAMQDFEDRILKLTKRAMALGQIEERR